MKGIRVQLICVGKMKEKFYIDAAAEYVKRLSAYCKLQVVELPEERLPSNPSQAQIDAALEKEAAAIRAKRPRKVKPAKNAVFRGIPSVSLPPTKQNFYFV